MKGKMELKPCPFCGESPKITKNMPVKGLLSISCENRKCKVHPHVVKYDKKSAANAWNNRTDGWIPVGERLPEDVNDCIVQTEDGDFQIAYYREDVSEWDNVTYGFIKERVIAWHHVPKPYKDGVE